MLSRGAGCGLSRAGERGLNRGDRCDPADPEEAESDAFPCTRIHGEFGLTALAA